MKTDRAPSTLFVKLFDENLPRTKLLHLHFFLSTCFTPCSPAVLAWEHFCLFLMLHVVTLVVIYKIRTRHAENTS